MGVGGSEFGRYVGCNGIMVQYSRVGMLEVRGMREMGMVVPDFSGLRCKYRCWDDG